MAETTRITCPETGELVEIDVERTPLGLVVDGCTHFHPRCALDCSRECAKRLDRNDDGKRESHERVLIVLANLHDDAARIANKLRNDLSLDNLNVELADLGTRVAPPLADYDAVVIGAVVRFGRHPRVIVDYVRDRRDGLAAIPAFFYSVGGHVAFDRNAYIDRMIRQTGWHPTASATFANAGEIQRHEILELAHAIADEIPISEPIVML